MMISSHVTQGEELVLYLEDADCEISDELDCLQSEEEQQKLLPAIASYIADKLPNENFKFIRVMAGSLLVGTFMLSPMAAHAAGDVKFKVQKVDRKTPGVGVMVDGSELAFDEPPFVTDKGRAMVPVRRVAEQLGFDVDWHGATSRVTLTRGSDVIELQIGSKTATVNGKAVYLDQAPLMKHDRTMVPVRFVSETFGAEVGWDEATQTVLIDTDGPDASDTPAAEPAPSPVAANESAPHSEVPQEVQADLSDLGATSVTAFQRAYGLPQTGTVDEATRTAIEHAQVKKQILLDANRFVGVPYRWGGETPDGFDCSGLVNYVFRQNGVNVLPRVSRDMFNVGTPIERDELQPGDLVYFAVETPGEISHVGIYQGHNRFISASSSKGVISSTLTNSYWGPKYVGAKRVY